MQRDRTEEEQTTRPQQGGEAETTRFGMEEGDNTEVPATGGPESWADDADADDGDAETPPQG
jgi:hypothetical protein